MRQRILIGALTLGLLLGTTACQGTSEVEAQTVDFMAMDTFINLAFYSLDDTLIQEAKDYVLTLEGLISTTVEDSELYQLNQTGEGTLSPESIQILSRGLELCQQTEGALDISIYPVVRSWGFTTGEYQIPQPDVLQSLVQLVDYQAIQLEGDTVTLAEGMELDLGSIAKGYVGDQIADMAEASGVTSGLLTLGGNIQAIGTKPTGELWRVGIQDPAGDAPLGVVEVDNQAVVTSGGYERYFVGDDGEIYWHIIDPETGYPARAGLISVTIVAESGAYSDALSTALFVMGLEEAVDYWQSHQDFDFILMTEAGDIYVSHGLEERFSLLEGYQEMYSLTVISKED